MQPPITILVEIPDDNGYVVCCAWDKIGYIARWVLDDIPDSMKQDAIRTNSKCGDRVRLPIPVEHTFVEEDFEPWLTLYAEMGWRRELRVDLECDEVTLRYVRLDGRYKLCCGFAPKLRKWVVSGELTVQE